MSQTEVPVVTEKDLSIQRQSEIYYSPEGTEIPEIGCQWNFAWSEDNTSEKYGKLCGIKPTTKTDVYYLFCQEHLKVYNEKVVKYREQLKIKRLIVKVKSDEFYHDSEFPNSTREVVAHQVKKPRFKGNFGRTWDTMGRTELNEKVIADSTWGTYGYVERNSVTYKFRWLPTPFNDKQEKELTRMKAKGSVV